MCSESILTVAIDFRCIRCAPPLSTTVLGSKSVSGQIYLQYASVEQRLVFFNDADMNAIVALLPFCCRSGCYSCCS